MTAFTDERDYYRYTGPQRLDKAIHSLEGLLQGVAADRSAHDGELHLLRGWLDEHREFHRRHPFNEIIPKLDGALSDDILDKEEIADVIWLCSRMKTGDAYFDQATSDMQRLQGIMGGIAADGIVTMEELESLQEWMNGHENLRKCWPYDEVESLIVSVKKDGMIDRKEHQLLVSFLSEFTASGRHRTVGLPLNEASTPVTAMCAVCPEVRFEGRVFCFTGASAKATRQEMAEIIQKNGGTYSHRVVPHMDYLVIGADGNPSWAFACYGRKVEQALAYRKTGSRMLLVYENDFWDAVAEAEGHGIRE